MLVSVIIPCYNAAAFVQEAVESAIAQTHRPLEIICVDNNSTDDTLAILRRLEEQHPNLIRVFEEPQAGAPAARNCGLQHAWGKWIQFLDADDLLYPDKIERQLALREADTELIIGSYDWQTTDGRSTAVRPLPGDPYQALYFSRFGNTVANLWRKAALPGVAAWDTTYPSCQDYDLLLRLVEAGVQWTLDPEPSALIRQQENSVSRFSPNAVRGNYRFRLRVYPYLILDDYPSQERDQIHFILFKTIRDYGLIEAATAKRQFHHFFPQGYRLTDPSIGRLYYWAYRGLGFGGALTVFRWYVGLFKR